MRTIIFGTKGMLGSDLASIFSDWNPKLLGKEEIDIADEKAVFNLLRDVQPEVVINAAAYTDVDGCEANRELAISVNGDAPQYLAAASKEVGAIFVHYSTDYVFSGDRQEGYKEDDEPTGEPVNFYGESKLAGENAIREVGGKYYIIRTSWLFGLNGKNFVETMLRLAQEKDEVRIVDDQHGKPTYTLDLAKKTRELIEGGYEPGIYHMVNEPATTWYGFAKEIFRQAQDKYSWDKSIVVAPVDSKEFPRPAKRPEHSILLNTKLPPMRSWQEALRDYLQQRNKN